MAEQNPQEQATDQTDASTAKGLSGRAARLFRWAGESRLRMALVGSLLITACGGMFAAWSYLAHLAVDEQDRYSLARALEALDQKDYEKAKNIISEIQRDGGKPEEFGGALYVLGAVKGAQAEQEWSKDRQRAMHLIAARYLQKARELGVPKRLESQAQFLVGQSLVRGNQPQAGIEILLPALTNDKLPTSKIHRLLSEAYQSIGEPDWSSALKHNVAALNEVDLEPEQRNDALITQAEIFGIMGHLDDAKANLQLEGTTKAQQARIQSISGQLSLTEALRLPLDDPRRAVLAERARTELRDSQLLDPLNSELTRQSMYWIGKSYEVEGNRDAAIQQYDQLGKSYSDTPESTAALLAKADLERKAEKTEQALADYRAVLDSVSDPLTYINRLLPMSALKKRLFSAYNSFVESDQFEEAMTLADSFQPVFSLKETTLLRAQAHEKWARSKIIAAADAFPWEAEKLLTAGRYHHRAAGTAFELLSELRYASREFSEDLWSAAENYYNGQSYSHAERMLEKYLHHEASKKQALALLRLGQARLALAENTDAIDSLEECIEMYPADGVVYQARLECAHAHMQEDNGARAEQLLLKNLVGGSLKPTAPEWRDSLFLLGDYLHNTEQYDQAIKHLDEAVRRVENLDDTVRRKQDSHQALFARYTIARSYHSAAEEPAKLAIEAKTESERQKNRKRRDENLNKALENYLQVQRMLTLQGHVESNELERMLLRNCYMMQGSVLFQLKRYEEARKAYANISTLYQNEPFVLESFVHIANCYRRLNKPVKAKGTIEQAKLVLNRLPADTDFKLSTNFSRQSWELLLNEMSEW